MNNFLLLNVLRRSIDSEIFLKLNLLFLSKIFEPNLLIYIIFNSLLAIFGLCAFSFYKLELLGWYLLEKVLTWNSFSKRISAKYLSLDATFGYCFHIGKMGIPHEEKVYYGSGRYLKRSLWEKCDLINFFFFLSSVFYFFLLKFFC